jgi:hypothetical protein
MKLTGTNRSIGLIILIRQCPPQTGWQHTSQCPLKTSFQLAICRPGGSSGAAAPDPIPNSAVKRPSAHDTSSQDAGKSVAARSANRKLPIETLLHNHHKKPLAHHAEGLFAFHGRVSALDPLRDHPMDVRCALTQRPGRLPSWRGSINCPRRWRPGERTVEAMSALRQCRLRASDALRRTLRS